MSTDFSTVRRFLTWWRPALFILFAVSAPAQALAFGESTQIFATITTTTGAQYLTLAPASVSDLRACIGGTYDAGHNLAVYTPRPQNVGSFTDTNWPSPGGSYANISYSMEPGVAHGDNFDGTYSLDTDPGSLWSSPSSGTTYFFFWYHHGTSYDPCGYLVFTYDPGGSSTPPPPVVDTTTRVMSVIPVDGSTIATSSTATIGADVYVNTNDFHSGMYVEIRYARFVDSQAAVSNIQSLFTTFDFPITSSGESDFSTTTPILGAGKYTMSTKIYAQSAVNNILNFFGFGQFANFNVTTASSTIFIAAAPNQFDNLVASTTASIDSFLASTTVDFSSCSTWTSFNLYNCVNLMLYPQTQIIAPVLTNFKNTFLSYAPWGYATRFITILSSSATSTLPSLVLTVPQPLPGAGDQLDLTPWARLLGSGSMLDTATSSDNKTLRQATEMYWDWVVYVLFGFAVAHLVLGIAHGGKSQSTSVKNAKSV